MPQSREGEGPQRRRKGLAAASSGCREKKLSWRNPEMGGGGDLPDDGLRAILASTNFVREREGKTKNSTGAKAGGEERW